MKALFFPSGIRPQNMSAVAITGDHRKIRRPKVLLVAWLLLVAGLCVTAGIVTTAVVDSLSTRELCKPKLGDFGGGFSWDFDRARCK
jgi:hypothetical protein